MWIDPSHFRRVKGCPHGLGRLRVNPLCEEFKLFLTYSNLLDYHRPITTESTIMIQPYAARRFRRRKKTKRITISGDLVFRLFLANAKPGDRYGARFPLDC
jgi:hypothetical protein